MKTPGKPLTVFMILMAAAAAFYIYSSRKAGAPKPVTVSGIVDGVEVNLSSKVSGRIAEICCTEGSDITEGSVAVRLDSAELAAAVAQAEAGVERARAGIRVAESSVSNARALLKSTEAEILSAEAGVQKARAFQEKAAKDLQRAAELSDKDFVSKSALDQARADHDATEAALRAEKAALDAAASGKEAAAAQLLSSLSQLNAARAVLKEAVANLDLNRSRLKDTVISSPVSGTVIFRASENGETVSPGGAIMTIVDMKNLYVRVDLDETLMEAVGQDSGAVVKTLGPSGKTLRGRVATIGRYAGFATERDVVRGKLDIKTYRLKISVEDPARVLKPGMTVEVEIPGRGPGPR